MKRILVIARHNQAEALRVAAGLTLLSDPVQVAVLGAFEDTPAIAEHRELLEFAEVPCEVVDDQPWASGSRAPSTRPTWST
ncbi:MAG: hypothetical protein IPH30_14195 [Betaproteobacteria bacterium]|nr:hypothetical protein [Betaproteobacteria bacterium]